MAAFYQVCRQQVKQHIVVIAEVGEAESACEHIYAQSWP